MTWAPRRRRPLANHTHRRSDTAVACKQTPHVVSRLSQTYFNKWKTINSLVVYHMIYLDIHKPNIGQKYSLMKLTFKTLAPFQSKKNSTSIIINITTINSNSNHLMDNVDGTGVMAKPLPSRLFFLWCWLVCVSQGICLTPIILRHCSPGIGKH